MTRRQFAFWIGLGLFNLSEKLRAESLETLAAATMRRTEPKTQLKRSGVVHWRVDQDEDWRWFERENLIDDEWVPTGITAPIHMKTGERKAGGDAYLDDSLVPTNLRAAVVPNNGNEAVHAAAKSPAETHRHLPNETRRGRHGRPPSKWLRSLDADELRIWLKTIEVPEAGVEGMTYFEHLTRDHSFDPARIEGLKNREQAKLHAAAHYGY